MRIGRLNPAFKMSKFILAKKLSMTQIFEEDGRVAPVTLVGVEPNVVTRIKNVGKDGYQSVQVGTGSKKNSGGFKYLREFKITELNEQPLKEGDKLDVSVFESGDMVRVSGVTKGKGFAGAVKRHGFSGMPSSHGHKSVKRHIGSIGQRFPQHTLKGKRMAGHMGNVNFTVRGLMIARIDNDNQIIAIRGAVPGNAGGLVKIESISK